MKSYINILKDREKLLLERLEKIQQDAMSSHSADSADRAQERENDEVLDGIGNTTRAELSRVTHALERCADSTYGHCLKCHTPIDLQRLDALPETEFCIQCAD